VTRAELIAAIADVLDEAANECVPAHRDIGERVADRMGLPAEVAEVPALFTTEEPSIPDTDPAPPDLVEEEPVATAATPSAVHRMTGRIVTPEDERADCEACNGMGDYYHENVSYTCHQCAGAGKVEPDAPAEGDV